MSKEPMVLIKMGETLIDANIVSSVVKTKRFKGKEYIVIKNMKVTMYPKTITIEQLNK